MNNLKLNSIFNVIFFLNNCNTVYVLFHAMAGDGVYLFASEDVYTKWRL